MHKRLLTCLFIAALARATLVQAAELQPFTLNYKASYSSLDGTATRSLAHPAGADTWEMKSKIEVKLLGSVVASVEETSAFSWQNDLPVSTRYDYVQKGIGKRTRKMEFAANGQSATYAVNDKTGTLTLTPPAFDNLTSGLMLRKHVLTGETDISFTVADKEEASKQSYQVVGKESTVTPAGTFSTVHIKRVRDTDSKRTTDIWLAPDHDYVMVKMLQVEPDGDKISLELKSGVVGGKNL